MDLDKMMDRIDDCKKRDAINDMSVIAYQLINEIARLQANPVENRVSLPKPDELKPGQIWMGDADFPYQHCYKGEFAYILMSIEPDDKYWKVAQWQEWEYGAQRVEFTEEEIKLMKYIGHIKDVRRRSN